MRGRNVVTETPNYKRGILISKPNLNLKPTKQALQQVEHITNARVPRNNYPTEEEYQKRRQIVYEETYNGLIGQKEKLFSDAYPNGNYKSYFQNPYQIIPNPGDDNYCFFNSIAQGTMGLIASNLYDLTRVKFKDKPEPVDLSLHYWKALQGNERLIYRDKNEGALKWFTDRGFQLGSRESNIFIEEYNAIMRDLHPESQNKEKFKQDQAAGKTDEQRANEFIQLFQQRIRNLLNEKDPYVVQAKLLTYVYFFAGALRIDRINQMASLGESSHLLQARNQAAEQRELTAIAEGLGIPICMVRTNGNRSDIDDLNSSVTRNAYCLPNGRIPTDTPGFTISFKPPAVVNKGAVGIGHFDFLHDLDNPLPLFEKLPEVPGIDQSKKGTRKPITPPRKDPPPPPPPPRKDPPPPPPPRKDPPDPPPSPPNPKGKGKAAEAEASDADDVSELTAVPRAVTTGRKGSILTNPELQQKILKAINQADNEKNFVIALGTDRVIFARSNDPTKSFEHMENGLLRTTDNDIRTFKAMLMDWFTCNPPTNPPKIQIGTEDLRDAWNQAITSFITDNPSLKLKPENLPISLKPKPEPTLDARKGPEQPEPPPVSSAPTVH